ncbi:MAG: hypothetical protein FJ139_03365 [Deltaproteobacteria bacterium]|nr:hypothetical protein [Deltaproteobacteria bacterium]
MIDLRRSMACVLILAALVFSASDAIGADDVMVLRYDDGYTQRIKLDRPSESIRQIEFLEGRRGQGRDDRGPGHIKVISATYGGNCGAPRGNVTRHLAESFDGKTACEYVIDFRTLGDPAPGCAKDYFAEWQCGRVPERRSIGARHEAGGGTRVLLRCPVK